MKVEILSPSQLQSSELLAWARMITASSHLQRAFFTPTFARACEIGFGSAFVALFHQNGNIRAFFPFQFRNSWHSRVRLAERIGSELSDNSGLIAEPDFTIDPATLLDGSKINVLYISHLNRGQEAFGLTADKWEINHQIDLRAGKDDYFLNLRACNRRFVQDTERRIRRAIALYGPLIYTTDLAPRLAHITDLIEAKRRQYARTRVQDSFGDPRRLLVLEALANEQAPDCTLVLSTLSAGDQMLARHLGLLCAGVLSYWFPVYDEQVNKVAPGRLLLWHILHDADALGIKLIDRGAGDSQAKRDFSNSVSHIGTANFAKTNLRGRLVRVAQSTEWRIRYWRKGPPDLVTEGA